MAVAEQTLQSGGPAIPVRPLVVSPARTLRRIGVDRWTSRLIIVGGLVVIASILGILLVILAEAWPLFRSATAQLLVTTATTGEGAAPWRTAGTDSFDVDEYREVAFAIGRGRGGQVPVAERRPAPRVPRRSPSSRGPG